MLFAYRVLKKATVKSFICSHMKTPEHGLSRASGRSSCVAGSTFLFQLVKFCLSLRLRLHWIGYFQIHLGSDPLWHESTVYTGPVLNWNGTVPHRITFISGSIWYQIADPIRTGFIKSRVNTRLMRTSFVPVPNGSGPV